MSINSNLFRFIAITASAIFMSFAWPVRGQFGHWWGSSITGAMAALILTTLIPWKNYREALPQSVIWGAIGFAIGGEVPPYGALVDNILTQPTFAAAFPELIQVFFLGLTWGAIGSIFLGYGLAEVSTTFWDFAINIILAIATILIAAMLPNPWLQISVLLVGLALMSLYNLFVRQSKIVGWLGLIGGLGFGLGFFIAVVILFLGTKGMLSGPPNWWQLRDQIWGLVGGLFLGLCGYFMVITQNLKPVVTTNLWIKKIGFLFLIPLIGGLNLYNVYEKWFQSTPAAPDLLLAGILIAIGAVLLIGVAIIYLLLPANRFHSPQIHTLSLRSFVFFAWYLSFFAIAKSIVYSGWSAWETAFPLFILSSILVTLLMPFILLGSENP